MTSTGYRISALISKGEPAARPTVQTGMGQDSTVVTVEGKQTTKQTKRQILQCVDAIQWT